jgi:hypothetical protein
MNLRPGSEDSEFLSADALAVEAELRAYTTRVAPMPSAAFMDRVVAAAERSPRPIAGLGPRVRATGLVHEAVRRLRVALAQVAGGPSIPLRVRIQAAATLVVVALLITGSVALAAAGATSVVTWVTGPQVPAAGSSPSASPAPGATLSTDTSLRSDHPDGSNPGNGGNKPSQNPGNCGQPSQNPGNGNRPSENPGNCGQAGQNPGNCGQPSQNPGNGNRPSGNPGNCGRPSQNPGNRPSNHPNPTDNPGNGGRPTKEPRPTAPARP